MGDKTGISWTDATWNVVIGCSRVSPGCQHCYAEVQAARIVRMAKGKPTAYDGLVRLVGGEPRWTGIARFVSERLAWPLRKRTPLRIFVNSMSDLFHADVTNEQIAAVFGVMAACPQHTFQILTKRPQRMREWFEWIESTGYHPSQVLATSLEDVAKLDDSTDPRFVDEEWLISLVNVVKGWSSWRHHIDDNPLDGTRPRWPLPNVWLGVSVENQEAADERIPELLRAPAAVRFLSCEPLLGPVRLWSDIEGLLRGPGVVRSGGVTASTPSEPPEGYDDSYPGLDWVIAGCESGPGARLCSVDWLRSLRDQCAVAGVPIFVKQAVESAREICKHCGGRVVYRARSSTTADASCGCTIEGAEDCSPHGVMIGEGSKQKPGGVIELPYIDGVQHAAFPEPR